MAEIKNVSDTALWVAVYRADETKRPDALFKDPFAERLVGDRGREIAANMPHTGIMQWVLVVRTVAIDRLVMKAIEEGADTILNLGAGLDTRPYRMKLPANLRWIEVDFPHMIDHKNTMLKAETPVCKLERIALDLGDRKEVQALFKRVNDESKKVLVITEGVIPYLKNEHAAALADDLKAQPNFASWIMDYFGVNLRLRNSSAWQKKMKSAPMQFQADDWMVFFGGHGWKVRDQIRTMEEAKRIGRATPPLPLFRKIGMALWFAVNPGALRKIRESSGYVRFQRSN